MVLLIYFLITAKYLILYNTPYSFQIVFFNASHKKNSCALFHFYI